MPEIIIRDSQSVLIDRSVTVILDCEEINIEYDLKDGEYAILIFNDHHGNVTLNESGKIRHSHVQISYLQLEKYDLKQYSRIDVMKDSQLEVHTTYLGTAKKDVVFDLFNRESDSFVNISNNIVCLDQSSFSMDCIGTIVKGAKRSKCHQSSHCLTIDDPKKARVLPVLNIDENDVEASHSLAMGTIDEEVLFYMNSRGLNKKESLQLILRSYLMPSDDFYESFDNGRKIQEAAVRKVDEVCSM